MCNQNQTTINKFGKKMKELCEVVAAEPNWREYVEEGTVELIEDLFVIQNLSLVIEKHDLNYPNIRAKYLTALDRIKSKNTSKIRNGKSDKAKKLLDLIDGSDDWKTPLTDKEILLADLFRKHKNFYEVGRILDIKPSNVAGTLYGTSQRKGVINKIESYKKSIVS